MDRNSRLFYIGITEVYEKLVMFCIENGLKVKESKEKFFFIKAEKSSLLFWKNIRLDLEILAVEKTRVKVTAKIYKYRMRQSKLENKYIDAIEKYLNFTE